jgi:tryptophanase
MSKLQSLTSNQYYGGLNKRFDKRAALLRRFGFSYQRPAHACRPGESVSVGVFVRAGRRRDWDAIPAATLLHADNRAWRDTLKDYLKTGFPAWAAAAA